MISHKHKYRTTSAVRESLVFEPEVVTPYIPGWTEYWGVRNTNKIFSSSKNIYI